MAGSCLGASCYVGAEYHERQYCEPGSHTTPFFLPSAASSRLLFKVRTQSAHPAMVHNNAVDVLRYARVVYVRQSLKMSERRADAGAGW